MEFRDKQPAYNATLLLVEPQAGGGNLMTDSRINLDELKKTLQQQADATSLLAKLARTVEEQARQIDELKRSGGQDNASLQRRVEEQGKQLELLKRGGNDSSKDTAGLQRQVEEQKRALAQLQRTVDELSRKAGSSSSSSELNSLSRSVSEQDRKLDNLRRSVEDLGRRIK
ncbi:hypothetical protein P0Y43_18710 [Pseudomonas entomophila]|uniref:hypothetical protein n=1 Tax=Pseudomonas entomophila TaxID=312306 RepID=UPI0023D8288E|nr:hypothetical protein [Pseudomonas entomophila]MDF0732722.1 hypothetical protein [Pseudomonas entomophila]